ncbi:hypothetical protein O9929_01590 [Vibrio lentus]|nr:hypothetical protein [Vibrio lentus]
MARLYNPKNVTATIPVGLFSCITGSGSGKSTLINDTFFKVAHTQLNGATTAVPAQHKKIKGLEHFDKVIDIDQSPTGRTTQDQTPQPYTGIFVANSRYFVVHKNHDLVATSQADSVLTFVVVAVKRNSKGRCHQSRDAFYRCMYRVMCKGKRYNRETL